jgi:hypothetical protein
LTRFPVLRSHCANAAKPNSHLEFNGLPAANEKFRPAMHFSLAYVTRVTYKTRTLHRCAGIQQSRARAVQIERPRGPSSRQHVEFRTRRDDRTTAAARRPISVHAEGLTDSPH